MMAAIYMHATIEELLEAVFYLQPEPRLYNEDQLPEPMYPVWRRSRIPPS
jgi:hypothetical protein